MYFACRFKQIIFGNGQNCCQVITLRNEEGPTMVADSGGRAGPDVIRTDFEAWQKPVLGLRRP